MTKSNEVSDEQWIVVYVLQFCSASLSVMGSSTIVFKILRDRVQKGSTTPYDRIVLGLSICDVFASITYAIDQFLYPSETSPYVWSFGSPATCRALGFLQQLWPFWAIWYNGLLSFYFLLTALSQARRKDFVQKFEPWMHLSGICFPVTAILGLRREWYDDLGVSCWITDPNIQWIVGGIPTMFAYLSVIINYAIIYAVVRKSLQSNESAEYFAGRMSVQKRLKREATTIMFSYVGSFFVTVSPNFVLVILYAYGYANDNEGKIYPLVVLNAIFLPLQGFFNVFIYLKPAYTRFRAANPNKPMHFVLHQALFNPRVPQLYYPSDISDTASNTNDISMKDLGISGIVFEEDEKVEDSDPNSRRKMAREKPRPRKTSMDSEEDDSLSDSTA